MRGNIERAASYTLKKTESEYLRVCTNIIKFISTLKWACLLFRPPSFGLFLHGLRCKIDKLGFCHRAFELFAPRYFSVLDQ